MKVTDPDNLDRFQVIFDYYAHTISLRGLGTQRHAMDQTGDSDGTTTFTDAGANFTTDGVQVGDILSIISADAGGIMGHYRVASGIGTTTLVVDRAIPASASANLTYKINAPQTLGAAGEQLADGVTMQALYSFAKEEWITLAAGLGNAVDLNRFTFPFTSITTEEFILGGVVGDQSSAWAFMSNNGAQGREGMPRELIRTAGWQERNASDVVLREYLGVITLGSLDTDAQAYYQQHADDIDPEDFKLLGVVDQAVEIYREIAGPSLSVAITGNNTMTRNDGGNWYTDGFRAGGRITNRASEDAGNNGTFTIVSVANSANGAIVVSGTPLTNNADDDTMVCSVNKKFKLNLRCRKKQRSYAKATELNAGIDVSAGQVLLPKVARFPLAHASDPAITLDDGVMGGNGTATGDVFQAVESHSTGSNGVTSAPATDGTFTFTSSGATFNSTARGAVQILQPGDTLEITAGGPAGDRRTYIIKTIDSATQLTCYQEPSAAFTGSGSSLSFTVRTRSRDVGAANATLANVDGNTGTLTSAGSTFNADNGLGDRTVVVGDMVEVTAGTGAVIGVYKVVTVDSATQLTLNTSDQIFGGQTSQTYRITRPGMRLQRFETLVTASGMTDGLNINGAGNPDTLTRTGGSWVTDGFSVVGMAIQLVAAEDAGNVGKFIVGTPTPTATVVTLIASESMTTNTDDDTAVNGNVKGDYGVIRTVNGVKYPFHWRLFANGGSLAQVFQFIQWQLRKKTDVDFGNGVKRGDITDLLMSFASPNGTTIDMYPDNLSTTELNNVTYQDLTGDSRTNPFIVGITLDVNANLINSALKRLTVYFTTNPAGNFDSANAVIVDDKDGVDMNFTSITGDISTSFDYTNNNQGGRTPDQDAAITIVALGTDLAQHIVSTQTITKVNALTFQVGNALERNYDT